MSYKRVVEWNTRVGKNKFSDKAVLQQISYILEGAEELEAALNDSNSVEVLDAVCDIMFTYYHLIYVTTKTDTLDIKSLAGTTTDLRELAANLKNMLKTATTAREIIFDGLAQVEGMRQVLIARCFDVDAAFEAVCDNNDLKFYSKEVAESLREHLGRTQEDFKFSVCDAGGGKFYVKRVEDGKICKSPHHPMVKIEQYTGSLL